MSFYDDKGVWVLPTATGGHRLFTDADSCVDDALVMVTGLHLAGSGGSTSGNPCAAIRDRLPRFFALEGGEQDWAGRCLTLAHRPVARRDWEALYRETGQALAQINLNPPLAGTQLDIGFRIMLLVAVRNER